MPCYVPSVPPVPPVSLVRRAPPAPPRSFLWHPTKFLPTDVAIFAEHGPFESMLRGSQGGFPNPAPVHTEMRPQATLDDGRILHPHSNTAYAVLLFTQPPRNGQIFTSTRLINLEPERWERRRWPASIETEHASYRQIRQVECMGTDRAEGQSRGTQRHRGTEAQRH